MNDVAQEDESVQMKRQADSDESVTGTERCSSRDCSNQSCLVNGVTGTSCEVWLSCSISSFVCEVDS